MQTEDKKLSDLEHPLEITTSPDEEKVSQLPQTAKPKRRWWHFVFLALILVGGVVGWRTFTTAQNTSSSQEETKTVTTQARLPVRVVPAKTAPIQGWVFSDGTVSAIRYKHLTFPVEGTITYVKKVNGRDLREGDFVREGEVLARVDQRRSAADVTVAEAGQAEAQNQVTAANAEVLRAQAGLREAEANLLRVQADLKKAENDRNFARTDLQRYESLWKQGAISKSDRDVKENQYKNTEAGVEAAQSQVTAARATLESAKGQVTAAQAQLESAKSGVRSASAQLNKSSVNLEDTVIRAPFDGVIAYLNIKEGDYWMPQRVQPNADYQNIVETVPIIVNDPKQFEVNVELPAFQGANVRPGQRAFIVLDEKATAASVGQMTSEDLIKLATAQGTVFSVSPSVTPGGRAVQAVVRISEGAKNLQPGARVSTWIAIEEKNNATVAPLSAFVFRNEKPHVFVVNQEKGIVEQRQIQPGIEGISRREILQGVKPGELIVTEGHNRLVNGAPVEVVGNVGE
ncbi:MAG: efflux RND transporter periplasmic adaptor subunit [Cyanobacteriota bacterium]